MITRVQAANLLDALDEYLDARDEYQRIKVASNYVVREACRERLMSRMADEEPTEDIKS